MPRKCVDYAFCPTTLQTEMFLYGLERLPKRETSAIQARLDRTDRQVQCGGDLFIRLPFRMIHHHHHPLVVRKAEDGFLQEIAPRLQFREGIRTRSRILELTADRVLVERDELVQGFS